MSTPSSQPTSPPSTAVPPPPTVSSPPPVQSSPPPPSGSTTAIPPPPDSDTPSTPSPPPPTAEQPPPPSTPSSPPPPSNTPPPPTPISPTSPVSSPPPPSETPPPATTPPPPTTSPPPPSKTPTPPASPPPTSPAPPPSTLSPPPPESSPPPKSASSPPPPPSNSTSGFSPPPPVIKLSPPPPSRSSPPPPTQNLTPPSNNTTDDISPSGGTGIGTAGIVGIGLGVGIIILSLIGLAIWCLKRRKKEVLGYGGISVMPSPIGSSPRSGRVVTDSMFMKTHSSAPIIGSGPKSDFIYSPPSEPGGSGNSRPLYSYEELVKATNGFSVQNLLGEGGFGYVYKGLLPDGREVAIKELKVGGGQGEREFRAEVETISHIHHRHLVSLVGYCSSENHRLLIYEYVPNETLYFHLHGGSSQVLDWASRVKIAAGAARGIAYLHEDCHPRIIHRDIKSSNILLDNNFDARVSDFGLAKLALDANTHVTTRVMGTFGYLAPEYASSGKLTEKSDVYSFGVVLLELITGRKPVDSSQPIGEESLVEWARPLLTHALENMEFDVLVDPRLGVNYIETEMVRMIEAAAACVRHSSAKRPRMGQIVRAFDNFATVDLSNGMRVGESEVLNSAQRSEEIRWFQKMAFGNQDYSSDFFNRDSL